MQQVMLAGGILYGALGTAVRAGASTQAGIEWFAVEARASSDGGLRAHLLGQGQVAKPHLSLIAPAIAVDGDGHGAIAFSLMGPHDYPTAAYVGFDVEHGTGPVRIAAAGVGPDDGLTNYAAAFGQPPRARWGDYGAAVVDGSRIWMASEYIGQSCTLAQWLASSLTCGGTRMGAANWDTRITAIKTDR